jgi:hypothetical protein
VRIVFIYATKYEIALSTAVGDVRRTIVLACFFESFEPIFCVATVGFVVQQCNPMCVVVCVRMFNSLSVLVGQHRWSES